MRGSVIRKACVVYGLAATLGGAAAWAAAKKGPSPYDLLRCYKVIVFGDYEVSGAVGGGAFIGGDAESDSGAVNQGGAGCAYPALAVGGDLSGTGLRLGGGGSAAIGGSLGSKLFMDGGGKAFAIGGLAGGGVEPADAFLPEPGVLPPATCDSCVITKAGLGRALSSLQEMFTAFSDDLAARAAFGKKGAMAAGELKTDAATATGTFDTCDGKDVFNVKGEQLSLLRNIVFKFCGAQKTVINVEGAGNVVLAAKFSAEGGSLEDVEKNVLWNFNDAAAVTFLANDFYGSVVAPKARVDSAVNIHGSVVAKEFFQHGDVSVSGGVNGNGNGKECPVGQKIKPDDTCVCPKDHQRTPDGTECVKTDAPGATCPVDKPFDAADTCACPAGYEKSDDKTSCVKTDAPGATCPIDKPFDAADTCVCPGDYEKSDDKTACVKKETETVPEGQAEYVPRSMKLESQPAVDTAFLANPDASKDMATTAAAGIKTATVYCLKEQPGWPEACAKPTKEELIALIDKLMFAPHTMTPLEASCFTASGDLMDDNIMIAASNSLPIGAVVRVKTSVGSAIVVVTDKTQGGTVQMENIDLTIKAAKAVGGFEQGTPAPGAFACDGLTGRIDATAEYLPDATKALTEKMKTETYFYCADGKPDRFNPATMSCN
jgi:choice-of-anchor A domain-containing protein